MSRPYEDITIRKCKDYETVTINVDIRDSGDEVTIPVYLNNVCPWRKMVVGVTLFVNGKPYATKVKYICTRGCRCWFCHRRRIASIFVGDFSFVLEDTYKEEISYRIKYHYVF